MRIGTIIRNLGPGSNRETLIECARAAEEAGLDHIWVVDHLAIPPDDAEGSGGRYLEPLATLALFAGVTETIQLGTAVLILPYRPPLLTAKWVATVQELSNGRLLLGVGAGWMEPEFRALGVPKRERGALADQALVMLHRCFEKDVVEVNGQPFIFSPRPPRPPILVGGTARAAIPRAARYGEGWFPMAMEPEDLKVGAQALREAFDKAGRTEEPRLVLLTGVPLDDPRAAVERIAAYKESGATDLVLFSGRYEEARAFRRVVDKIAPLREAVL